MNNKKEPDEKLQQSGVSLGAEMRNLAYKQKLKVCADAMDYLLKQECKIQDQIENLNGMKALINIDKWRIQVQREQIVKEFSALAKEEVLIV